MKATIILTSILFQFMAFNSFSANANQIMNPVIVETNSYVDDIPFDTEKVAKAYQQDTFSIAHIDAAAYIDDIPFETEKIVTNIKATEAMQVNFEMPAEGQIDDMPFNTEKIAAQAIQFEKNQMKYERMSK